MVGLLAAAAGEAGLTSLLEPSMLATSGALGLLAAGAFRVFLSDNKAGANHDAAVRRAEAAEKRETELRGEVKALQTQIWELRSALFKAQSDSEQHAAREAAATARAEMWERRAHEGWSDK